MNVLVVGSGGREHVIAWKLRQSQIVKNVYGFPGNPGTESVGECFSGDVNDFKRIEEIVRKYKIDLVFVGPEVPLVNGIVDYLSKLGIMVYGPNKLASQFEGSKTFTKNFLRKYNIPTAEFESFSDNIKALDYAKSLISKTGFPVVLKADGLAAGKGVIIADSLEVVDTTINDIICNKKFGDAGNSLVIEEFLSGDEASIFALISGDSYKILSPSQDHKQAYDGDKGPNTGGMGAYSPCPIVSSDVLGKVKNYIVEPIMKGLKEESIEYKGVLFIGLMICNGNPKVLEFNVRFGDPEAQVVLPLMKNDLAQIAVSTVEGSLEKINIETVDKFGVCITLASGGYPDSYEKGKIITGTDKFIEHDDVLLFHAGTKYEMINNNRTLVTSGGRVLSVVALDNSLDNAINKVYDWVRVVSFDNMHYRKDIGRRKV